MDADLDAAFDRIASRAAALALPETVRATSYGTPSLQVRNQTIVRLYDAQIMVLHCPEEQKTLLLEIAPDIYFQTDHYVGSAAVLVRLDAISDEELGLRLEDAWRHKAPKTLADQRPTRAPQQ